MLAIGCGLLAVGLVDLAHLLSYKGMPDFVTEAHPEKAINFWLVARYLAAATLLAVAWRDLPPLQGRRQRLGLLLAAGLGLSVWGTSTMRTGGDDRISTSELRSWRDTSAARAISSRPASRTAIR